MTRRRSLRAVIGAGLGLALLLSGCAALPRTGAVTAGQSFDEDQDAGEFLRLPASPVQDASPEEIVEGFIAAGTGSQSDYGVARQFLSAEEAEAWSPNAGVVVSAARPQAVAAGDGSYRVSVSVVASVDASGHFAEQPAESRILEYTVAQDPATLQWRIQDAPDGLLLPMADFTDAFSQHALYFYEPSYRYLVPDVRWFPRGPSMATRIVRAVLEGPSSWLGNGVLVTAAPEGAQLSVNAVTVSSGRARIDVTEAPTTTIGLQRLRAQLSASLRELNTVSGVILSVNQAELNIPDFGADAPLRDPVLREQRPLIVQAGQVGLADDEELRDVGGLSGAASAQQPRALVYSEELDEMAVLAPNAAVIVRGGAAVEVVPGAAFDDLAFDNDGYLWAAAAASGGGIQIGDGVAPAIGLTARWLEAGRIVSLELSRDGARALVLLEVNGRSQLMVAGVVREADGRPVSLGEPFTVATGGAPLIDASWDGESGIAALVAGEGDAVLVREYTIGGRTVDAGSVAGAQTIVAGDSSAGLLVRDADGGLWNYSGSTWQRIASEVEVLGEVR